MFTGGPFPHIITAAAAAAAARATAGDLVNVPLDPAGPGGPPHRFPARAVALGAVRVAAAAIGEVCGLQGSARGSESASESLPGCIGVATQPLWTRSVAGSESPITARSRHRASDSDSSPVMGLPRVRHGDGQIAAVTLAGRGPGAVSGPTAPSGTRNVPGPACDRDHDPVTTAGRVLLDSESDSLRVRTLPVALGPGPTVRPRGRPGARPGSGSGIVVDSPPAGPAAPPANNSY